MLLVSGGLSSLLPLDPLLPPLPLLIFTPFFCALFEISIPLGFELDTDVIASPPSTPPLCFRPPVSDPSGPFGKWVMLELRLTQASDGSSSSRKSLTPSPLSFKSVVVNSGSKLATDSSDSTTGLKGGVTCLRESAFQSMGAKKVCSFSSAASRWAPNRCLGFLFNNCTRGEWVVRTGIPKRNSAYPFHKLLPIFVDNASGESDLPKADVLVHLLCVFCVERTPAATHLEQKYTE